MMEEESTTSSSRQLAPMTQLEVSLTQISQVTKQLGLATSAEIMRASKGIAMVLDKIAVLESRIGELATKDIRMYPTKSEETSELSAALSKAKRIGLKALYPTGTLNGKQYYQLEDFIKAFTEPFDDNKLALDFFMDFRNGTWVLVGRLEHWTTKQWKETSAELNDTPVSTRMNEDQAASSSLTYKKRDAWRMFLGL
jgi:hypothetical protein